MVENLNDNCELERMLWGGLEGREEYVTLLRRKKTRDGA